MIFGFPTLRGAEEVAPNDPYYSYVILLGKMQGANGSTTIDETISGGIFSPNGNAQLSTARFPFGASSLLLDGTGDYLTKSLTSWNLHSELYTIDAWVYNTDLTPGSQGVIGDDISISAALWNFYVLVNSSGSVSLNGRGGLALTTATGLVAEDTWTHIECTGDGTGNHHIFVDGVHRATGTTTSYTTNAINTVVVGAQNPEQGNPLFYRYWNGNLFGVRITKGIQRHTGTASFTPPASLSEYAP